MWINVGYTWHRSHLPASFVRAVELPPESLGPGERARVSLTGGRDVDYVSRKTDDTVSYAAFRRWGPSRIKAEYWREWALEIFEPKKPPPPPPPPPKLEEWEVTVFYITAKGKIEDITVRLIGPLGAKTSQVRRVFWRAHKEGPGSLTGWNIEGIDWRGYIYPSEDVSLEEAMQNMAGIVNTVGMKGLRVALVEA